MVTGTTGGTCGEKSVMWRNLRLSPHHTQKSVLLQFTFFDAKSVLSRFTRFCAEKLKTENCVCGEKWQISGMGHLVRFPNFTRGSGNLARVTCQRNFFFLSVQLSPHWLGIGLQRWCRWTKWTKCRRWTNNEKRRKSSSGQSWKMSSSIQKIFGELKQKKGWTNYRRKRWKRTQVDHKVRQGLKYF